MDVAESCEDEASLDTILNNDVSNSEDQDAGTSTVDDSDPQPCRTKIKRKSENSALIGFGSFIGAESLIEYKWPHKSSPSYVIQEQIAEFLGITSFKRKYPDLSRRAVDKDEMLHIKKLVALSDIQCAIGLTAVRTSDVIQLIKQDYPFKLEEFKLVLADKEKLQKAAQLKDTEAVLKMDPKKMSDLRQKAIKAAVAWNKDLVRSRRQERCTYFDISTMTEQCPTKKLKVPERLSTSSAAAYPVAVMPSQYQYYYRRYSPDELRQMPLITVAESTEYMPKFSITDFQLEESNNCVLLESSVPSAINTPKRRLSIESSGFVDVAKIDRGVDTGEHCAFCRRDIFTNDRYVQCSKCASCGHPSCMEMNEDMYNIIKSYCKMMCFARLCYFMHHNVTNLASWCCVECKACSLCSKPDEEDKMLFCDRCDRGYHTFCVDLKELPTGQWLCPLYCQGKSFFASNTSSTAPLNGADEGLVQQQCTNCHVPLSKDNKIHLRSKYKNSGLCVNCSKQRQKVPVEQISA